MRLKHLLLFTASLFPLTVLASADGNNLLVEQTAADGTPTVFTADAAPTHQKAAADSVTITVKIVYDDSTASKVDGTTAALKPSTLHFFEAGGAHYFITIAKLQSSNYQVRYPKGTYDVMQNCTVNCRYRSDLYEKYKGVGNLYYIEENIDINNDTTLIIDFNEATNLIHFDPVTSKGKPFTFCTKSTASDKTVTYAQDGNMYDGGVLLQVVASGQKAQTSYNNVSAALAPRINHNADGTSSNTIGYYDILVTKCSSKYQFTNVRYGRSGPEDNFRTIDFVMQTVAGCSGDTTVTNSESDFITHKEYITSSVKGDSSTTHYCKATMFVKELGAIDLQAVVSNTSDTLKAGDPCVANYSICDPTGYYIPRLWLSLADYIPAQGTKYFIDGPAFTANGSQEHKYVDFGPNGVQYQFVYDEEKAKAVIVERPLKGLDMPYNEEKPYKVGNNVPSIMFTCPNYINSDGTNLGISLNCMGRYGEKRHVDWTSVGYEIYYNDVLAASGVGTIKLTSSNSALNKNRYSTGIVKYVVTDSNARFDGMPAASKAVHAIDMSQTDLCAPTLIYVRVHNTKQNTFDDHIATPSDNILEIVAADRNYIASGSYYDNKRVAEIKVSCSEHNANDWKDMAVTSVPENDDYLGYFYTVPLDGIAQQNDTVLYDLKVNLKDEAGNTQEQTISPVLLVAGTNSGVTDVQAAAGAIAMRNGCIVVKGEPTTVNVYDTCGRNLIANASSAQPISTAQLAPGIYIVRTAAETCKIAVRK